MADALPGTRAAGGGGISGLGVLGIVAGVVLIISGIKNASIEDTTRSLIRGRQPQGQGSMLPEGTGTLGGNAPRGVGSTGSATGAAVAAKAMTYLGVPYDWAHHTPDGWDCSGFVTWVLHHDFGIELPDNTHTVTGQFMVWKGARTVPRNDCQPGDLVCWIGHIGIATGRETMVHAPGFFQPTQVGEIGSGPLIRRPLAYGGGE